MGDINVTEVIDGAISKVGELGSRAGEAIKEFGERESVGRLAEGVKAGARTAAGGIAKGAKIAAGGIAEGTREASDIIRSNPEKEGDERKAGSAQEGKKRGKEKGRVFRLKNGAAIPAIGYGTYLSTEKDGKKVILDALDAGYRYIDTAAFYNNESEIGEALKDSGIRREDIFICSKVWPDMLGAEKTRESFEASCERLGTGYLNMFLIHWPRVSQSDEEWLIKLKGSWTVMEELYKEGRIRAIGLSNFLPHHIRPLLETARIRPMLDQLELHVGYMQEYTLKYLKQEKIMAQAWSPLGRAKLLGDERITKLAGKYGKSASQILLRYLIQRGIPAIPKTSDPERMRENLEVFDFALTEDEISYLSCITETGWSGEHPDLAEWG
ncbi:MAG: aldo/keto reductase [Lachnospiraceae bacterium]|nr:aldo/keto reductase [Lachnospiraceae bacterium]